MSIKRSIFWTTLGQITLFIAQFGSSVVIAHFLVPHDFGVYAIALAVLAMLSLVQNLGLQPFLVREATITDEILHSAFTANAVVSIALSILVFCCSWIAPSFYHEQSLGPVLRVLSVIPVIGVPAFLPGAIMERRGEFKELAFVTSVSGIASATMATLFAVSSFGVISLAFANTFGSVVLMTLLIVRGRRHLQLQTSVSEWRRILGFGAQTFAASGLINASPRLGEVVLGRILGLASLGLYNRANNLCNMIWGGIYSIIGRVVLVDFAKTYRDEGSLRRRYISTVAIMTGILWPAFIGLAVVAKPFITCVYGIKWEGAASVLSYLSISSAILVASTMAWEVCIVTGNIGIQIKIESIRFVVSLALLVIASLVSLQAVAMSRVIEAILAFFLYRSHLNRMTETRLIDFLPSYSQGLILSVGAAAPAFWFYNLSGIAMNPLAGLIAAVAVGGVVWLTLLFGLNHPLSIELTRTIRVWRWRRVPAFSKIQGKV